MTTPVLTCDQCGSARLRPQRPPWAKLFLGLFAPRSVIVCLDCRTYYQPQWRQAAKSSARRPTVTP